MKKLFLLVFASISFNLYGQVTNLGLPLGWKGKLNTRNIPVKTMNGFDLELINNQDEVNDKTKENPWRFGYKYNVDFNLENSGQWEELPNGDRIWQLIIECKEALTINLLFENFSLPRGAYLYLYDFNKTNKVGAYTYKNNRADGALGSELVHGEKIVIEYVEPYDVQGQGDFLITNVIHGYRSIGPIQDTLSRTLNSSGDCNIDVNCPLGDGWENEIRSVALIVVGGNAVCTGALINNTCNDGTPYFLTANHCLGGGTGNWAFRFNWESPPGTESCATTANSTDPGPPYDQTANGATTLVSGNSADFALLEIDNMTLSDAQNWNCFYAGWDATDLSTVTQATGIHHPSGDLKKICREDDSPYHSSAGGAAVWYIDEWEEGVTEPGSSGSPLFDQNHRIIGQLYGGLAACSGTVDNNQYDYYGRFGVSWNNGVNNYLAPNNCGESTINDGWDPNAPTLPNDAGISGISSPTGSYCVDNFDAEFTLRNYGTNDLSSVSISYSFDGDSAVSFTWTGNIAPGGTEAIILPNIITSSGFHTFNVFTSDPNGSSDSNPNNDLLSSNYSATIGGQDILFGLTTDCWGSEITWVIEDENSNILASGGPYQDIDGGESITESLCLSEGCYEFIINDTYGDGMYGSQWGSCDVDGSYTIINSGSGEILAEVIAESADYGDQETNNFCVSSPCSWTVIASTTEESCYGDDDGIIDISVSDTNGIFYYNIGSVNQNFGTFNNLSQGNYSVEVTDSSCSSITNVELSGPEPVSGNIIVNDISCNEGINDGSIYVEATGGVGDYSFDFGSGYTENGNLNNLEQGEYSISVQDGNGCKGNLIAIVGQPHEIAIDYNIFPESFGNDGEIDLIAYGGQPPYSFTWTGPQNFSSSSEDLINLTSGVYQVTIIDDNGCESDEFQINVDSHLSVNENHLDAFNVFPNPSNGEFFITFKKAVKEKIDIRVFDLTGRVVYFSSIKDVKDFKINLLDIQAGVYFLDLVSNEKHKLKRLVKQ
tara:strand:+ start:3109 stop:6105 length:2997 start_codon:yes stop_codon:yes gene_type:complete